MELEDPFEGGEGLGEFADGERLAFRNGGLEAGFELSDGALSDRDEFVEESGGYGRDVGLDVHGWPLLACDGERLARV